MVVLFSLEVLWRLYLSMELKDMEDMYLSSVWIQALARHGIWLRSLVTIISLVPKQLVRPFR